MNDLQQCKILEFKTKIRDKYKVPVIQQRFINFFS